MRLQLLDVAAEQLPVPRPPLVLQPLLERAQLAVLVLLPQALAQLQPGPSPLQPACLAAAGLPGYLPFQPLPPPLLAGLLQPSPPPLLPMGSPGVAALLLMPPVPAAWPQLQPRLGLPARGLHLALTAHGLGLAALHAGPWQQAGQVAGHLLVL